VIEGANFTLKDEIAAYWTGRSETFDHDIGHRIADGEEARAWQALIGAALGELQGKRVLDLGCGTGEVSRMLRALGADVTGVDLSEAMLERARRKLGGPNHRAYLGDAETLPDRDGSYDAVVARHLVWTLTDAHAAFAAWHRVLRPGGRLLVIDGDWVRPPLLGRIKQKVAAWLGPPRAGRDIAAHARIQARVHYREGLRADRLRDDLAEAGFGGFAAHDVGRVYRAMLRSAPLAVRLRMTAPVRFALSAKRSPPLPAGEGA
jgi:ubiquinone/menaquinone biosynthesis C-methylase UbiE